MIVRRLSELTASLSLLVACGVAPTFGSNRPLEIAELALDGLAVPIHPGGALSIRALLADTLQSLASGAGLPLRIFATSGDRERIELRSALCPVRKDGGFQYRCLGFTIVMKDGEDVRVLEPRLREWGGRFEFVAPRLWFASVLAVRHDGLVYRLREIEQWPGVAYVELTGRPGHVGHGPFPPYHARLHTTLAIEDRAVRVGDGELQAAVGDTVHIAYVQPSGEVISASAVVQPPPGNQCWLLPSPC